MSKIGLLNERNQPLIDILVKQYSLRKIINIFVTKNNDQKNATKV